MTPPTAEERDPSLAAIIGTVADGNPATGLDRAILRLKLVRQAKDRGLSWTQNGSVYGVSGREMKRQIHKLDLRVQRELMVAQNRERRRGPYVHAFAAPEPTGWDDDGNPAYPEPGPAYTMTGPGVAAAGDQTTGRQGGKVVRTVAAIREAVTRGEHVHVASRLGGSWCVEGPEDCTAERRTLAQAERELREG